MNNFRQLIAFRPAVYFAIALAMAACQTAPKNDGFSPAPAAAISHVDQIDYLSQLKALRPDLIDEDCKNNLILKPKYRPAVLAGFDSFQQVVQRETTTKFRKDDEAWAQSFRAAADKQRKVMTAALADAGFDPKSNHHSDKAYWDFLATLPFYVSDYDSASYVGYHVGAPIYYDTNGLSPKVYLTFRSATTDLTPTSYQDFTAALAKAGFVGDSKVQLKPGVARFQFNNIVVHAASLPAALIAEQVAQEFFGVQKLEAMSRGFDVADDRTGTHAKDWSHYLCDGGASKLSQDVLAFAASASDGEGITITPDDGDAESEIDDL